jgi:hypothetical protein
VFGKILGGNGNSNTACENDVETMDRKGMIASTTITQSIKCVIILPILFLIIIIPS